MLAWRVLYSGSTIRAARRNTRSGSQVSVVARSLIELAVAERRRHQRVKVLLSGRFMRSDRREFDCTTLDMSPGGVALASHAAVQPGERIVVYLDHLGRLEGNVARMFFGGFAIRMKLPPAKRDKLADQLTWLANRALVGIREDRRHERIEPRNRDTTIKFANGRLDALVAPVFPYSHQGAIGEPSQL